MFEILSARIKTHTARVAVKVAKSALSDEQKHEISVVKKIDVKAAQIEAGPKYSKFNLIRHFRKGWLAVTRKLAGFWSNRMIAAGARIDKADNRLAAKWVNREAKLNGQRRALEADLMETRGVRIPAAETRLREARETLTACELNLTRLIERKSAAQVQKVEPVEQRLVVASASKPGTPKPGPVAVK